ncbi:MAG TPA: TorF family putative porin [Burkholderiales bacterium]|nr:TorF family putative porin [Burkholderiales bacterium]
MSCLVTLLLARGVAIAEVSGQVAALSDYRYRGESLTGGRPAVQVAANYDHSSGLFLGGLASTVRIDPTASGLGAQLYGGYAQQVGERASWDIGADSNFFPHSSIEPSYDYSEAFVGVSYLATSVRLYYSNDYFGAGGRGVYLEVNASHPLIDRVSLIGHLGFLDHSQSRTPTTDRKDLSQLDFKAGIAIDLAEFVLELSIVGTSAERDTCAAGTAHCNTTGVVSISRSF